MSETGAGPAARTGAGTPAAATPVTGVAATPDQGAVHTVPVAGATGGRWWRGLVRWLPLVGLVVLALLPYSTIDIPVVFDGPLNKPGTLQLLASCLVFGGLAAGYDLLFGRAGLLSFGHALFFATGVYAVDILVTRERLPLWLAAVAAVTFGTTLAALVGAVALRTVGIAFAMVTLAFAQVGAIVVAHDPGGLTGGEEGMPMASAGLPPFLVGVANTVNLYWLALAYLAVTTIVVRTISRAPLGRVLAALRDDERRVAVLGLPPYRFKLVAFTAAGLLAALGGVVYALLVGGASPLVAQSDLTLSLLVMVVLGGPGTTWGPVLGGIVFTYLDQRLTALGGTPAVRHLPGVLRGPLSQPLFVLGTVFILAVYFAPGGLAGLGRRLGLPLPGPRGDGNPPPAGRGDGNPPPAGRDGRGLAAAK